MNVESKTTAAGVTGAAAAVLLWGVTEFTDVDMDAAVATAIVVVVSWAGSVLWPSKTSVVSSGFSPLSIPLDDLEMRQRIKAEVTAHPGSEHPKDPRNELGYGVIEIVVGVLLVLILVFVLLRII